MPTREDEEELVVLRRELERYKATNKELVEALQVIADGQGKYADIAKRAIGQ